MAKNLLLEYSEELATKCELLCKSISGNSNTVFQLRKSSSSVFANIVFCYGYHPRSALLLYQSLMNISMISENYLLSIFFSIVIQDEVSIL